jgi:hypothetical protein
MVRSRAGSFDAETLDLFDREEEVDIETTSAGPQRRRTTIWIVVADGVPFIRSVRGERGRWYRELRARPEVALHVAGRRIPVHPVLADDAESIEACSRALSAKYGDGPSTVAMLQPKTLGTTLRLEPG